MADWYHGQMPDLIPFYLSPTLNPSGSEPIPDSALLNDNATTSFQMTPGKTYMVRMIAMNNLAAFFIHFDGHPMTIIEVDGVYTEPQPADTVYLSAAQRMSVLITAKSNANQNYAFVGAMDPAMFDHIPPALNPNATGYLVYDSKKPLPDAPILNSYSAFNDFNLVPYDKMALLGPVDHQITLNIVFKVGFNQNRYIIRSNVPGWRHMTDMK